MIFSDSEKCRFCLAPIDRKTAEAGAVVQDKVNSACSQAKMLRNYAGAVWIVFLFGLRISFRLRLHPFVFIAGWGLLLFVVPIWLILWQAKFRNLQTADPDYKRAKRDRLLALVIWLPALALELLVLVVRLVPK